MQGCEGAIGGIQYLGEGEYLREFPGKSRLLKRFQGCTRRGTTHEQVTVHRVTGPLCDLGKSDAIGALVIYPGLSSFFLPNLSQLTETAGDINFRKWWGSISKNNGLQGFESGSWPASSLLVGCRISRNYAVFAGATASGKREARSESSVNTGRRPP